MSDPYGIGAAVGGFASGYGQHMTGKWQEGMTGESQNWSQIMRATAYQTAVKDLRKAGLNPALAYIQGPSQTPSAPGTPSGPDFGQGAGEAAQAFVNNVRQGMMIKSQLQKMRADAQAAESDAETAHNRAEASWYLPQLQTLALDEGRSRIQSNLAGAALRGSQRDLTTAEKLKVDVDRQLGETMVPSAQAWMRARAKMDASGAPGEALYWFDRTMRALMGRDQAVGGR